MDQGWNVQSAKYKEKIRAVCERLLFDPVQNATAKTQNRAFA
jgi:hypothetical protein